MLDRRVRESSSTKMQFFVGVTLSGCIVDELPFEMNEDHAFCGFHFTGSSKLILKTLKKNR